MNGEGDGLPAVLKAMLAGLSPEAQAELRRALHLQLFPDPTPQQRRERELGSLARLLRERGTWPAEAPAGFFERAPETRAVRRPLSPRERWPTIERTLYDELRAEGAPSSESLMNTYRAGWTMVCRAAAALPVEGESLSRGTPWNNALRGGPGTRSREPYNAVDCVDAVLRCARALGRDPTTITSTLYLHWSADQRARARGRAGSDRDRLADLDPRLPSWDVIRTHYTGWPALMRAVRRDLARGDRLQRGDDGA